MLSSVNIYLFIYEYEGINEVEEDSWVHILSLSIIINYI